MRQQKLLIITASISCSLGVSAAISDDRQPETPTALAVIFNDEHIAESALLVHQRAATMPTNERFEFLSRWVLPGEQHSTFRLNVEFTSVHGAGSTANGGQLVSPASDLVDVAAELGKLDSLQRQIESVSPQSTLAAKNQAAFSAMVLLKQNRIDEALVTMDRVRTLSNQEQPDDQRHRFAEAVLFHSGRRHPQVQEILRDSMDRIVQRQRKNNVWTIWSRQFRSLLALNSDADGAKFSKRLPGVSESETRPIDSEVPAWTEFEQWTPVSLVTAESRGSGMPPAKWQFAQGRADHWVSHADDFLYFQSPLRGTFAIECDCTAFNWNGSELQISGIWVRPIYTHAAYDVGNIRNVFQRKELSPPLTSIREKLHYRTVVEKDTATTYVNGRKLHVEPLSEGHDPWVAIRNDFRNAGQITNVRVTGVPDIPASLQIATSETLDGWLPYFGGSVGTTNSHWQALSQAPRRFFSEDPVPQQSGGLFGTRRLHASSGCFHEEALFYHRPMLDDGIIEYEFFYRENEVTAHPVIDRLCFLLHPAGVKIHWLTDGRFERTALSPDNELIDMESRRGPDELPLLANAWNKVRLTLHGNVIELNLNGDSIYRRELEPNNQRRLGFFHYADQTELQVRNVTWKGNWPRQIPSVIEQRLADEEGEFLDRNIEHLKSVFHHDFVQDGLPPERFTIVEGTPGADVVVTPDGVQAMRSSPGGYRNAKLALRLEALGDFDIVVAYDQFESSPPRSGSSTIFLIANVANEAKDHFFVTRRHMHNANGKQDQIMQCAIVRQRPEGEQREHFLSKPMEERSGRLRLARRGNKAYYLSAENDSPNFRLWATREFSTDPVAMNGIVLLTQIHQEGHTSVFWKDITVKAEKLSGAAVTKVSVD